VEGGKELGAVGKVSPRDPGIFVIAIADPFDEVLAGVAPEARSEDLFNFVLEMAVGIRNSLRRGPSNVIYHRFS